MQLRVGFELIYECPQPTPMIFNLNVHHTRVSDLIGRDTLVVEPSVPMAKTPVKKRLTNRKRRKCTSMVMPDNNPK